MGEVKLHPLQRVITATGLSPGALVLVGTPSGDMVITRTLDKPLWHDEIYTVTVEGFGAPVNASIVWVLAGRAGDDYINDDSRPDEIIQKRAEEKVLKLSVPYRVQCEQDITDAVEAFREKLNEYCRSHSLGVWQAYFRERWDEFSIVRNKR